VAVLLVVAGIVVYVQFGRIGGSNAPAAFPPDAPPAGVAVFYTREPGNPHGLVAYDWSGTRRGRVSLPTWVEISRLQPAPNGLEFFLNPATPGDYAAYFDRGGRTIFETDESGFISQAWAEDSEHLCVLSDQGLTSRLPGQPDQFVPGPSDASSVVGCSLRSGLVIVTSSTDIHVVSLSSGRTLRSLSSGGTVVTSIDATYLAVSPDPTAQVAVYRASDLSSPAAQLDAGLQPLAFSGDGSYLLVTQPGGEVKAVAWRTGKVAWTYNSSAAGVGFVVARPSGADFVLYRSTGAVLVRPDGTTRTFG
jgi:hypothetical protein